MHPVGLLQDLLWALVVERQGENPYITVPFHQSLLDRKFDKVPILTGFTSEEILSFIDSKLTMYDLLGFFYKREEDSYYLSYQKVFFELSRFIARKCEFFPRRVIEFRVTRRVL